METGIELSKNLTNVGIVLIFLLSVVAIQVSVISYFLKNFFEEYKGIKKQVEDHETRIVVLEKN